MGEPSILEPQIQSESRVCQKAGKVKAFNSNDEDGSLTGFSASLYNQIRGRQTGVSLGLVNYAYTLNGFQIGLINYVRDNPKYMRILPVLNAHFK